MNKKIKKIVTKLFPKGFLKEQIKLTYYNLTSPKGIHFSIVNKNRNTIYSTTINDIVINTTEPLYPVAHDFDCYQHFYQVKEGDTIIDAGANVGVLSIYFSKKTSSKGKIIAFEPDRFNVHEMKNNIELNQINNTISINESLLWNENTLLDFEEAGTVGSSAIWFSGKENVVKKQAITIDSWVKDNNIDKLDFIKMDIEGAEIQAIEGCKESIKKLKPNFAIASYHIVNGEPTYKKLEQFFKEIDYPFKTVKFKGTEIITFAGKL